MAIAKQESSVTSLIVTGICPVSIKEITTTDRVTTAARIGSGEILMAVETIEEIEIAVVTVSDTKEITMTSVTEVEETMMKIEEEMMTYIVINQIKDIQITCTMLLDQVTTLTGIGMIKIMTGMISMLIEIAETLVGSKTETPMIEGTITIIKIRGTMIEKISMATLPTICTIITITMIIIKTITGTKTITIIRMILMDTMTIEIIMITEIICQTMMYRRVSKMISGAKRMLQLIGTGLVALGFRQRFVAYWLRWENTCKGTTSMT